MRKPEQKQTGSKITDLVTAVIMISIIVTVGLYMYNACGAKVNFLMIDNQLSITKIGSTSAILDLEVDINITSIYDVTISVVCGYDKPKYIDSRLHYGRILQGENILREGNNKIEFVLSNLEPNTLYKCYTLYKCHLKNYNSWYCDDIRLPEFTTNVIPSVEIFKFVKPYHKITGSVTTNEVDGLTWWVEYGTPTTPYQLHTPKQPIIFDQHSNNTRSIMLNVELKELIDPTQDYKARIVVQDATGQKYVSDSVAQY